MRYAMIMAGGAGTRLWPMSRKNAPKQLIRFIQRPGTDAPVSLLELAAGRLEGLVPPDRRFICAAESYRSVIRRDLPSFSDEQILGEPQGRDTVNAVAFGAAVLAKLDPDAVFAVLTSDHIIEPDDVFRARMDLAFRLVEDDPRRLITFAIKPTYPATGFGYVERAQPIRGLANATAPDGTPLAYRVQRFVEKPDLARAQAYVKSGEFGWNSGMFVWKASKFLELFERHVPESAAGIREIASAWGTPAQRETIDRVYPTLKKISVDYGVMEPAAAAIKQGDTSAVICAVQMDLRWLDVGSWPSYAETLSGDAEGNRTAGPGGSLVVNGKNNLVVSGCEGKLVALLGVDDLVVVQTEDAILVMPRARSEELKVLHGKLDERVK
jgi:mannose-1-phosphate guanylyltransferase